MNKRDNPADTSAELLPMPQRRRFCLGAAVAAAACGLPFISGGVNSATVTYRAPGEFEPHAGVVMSFPWDASNAWGGQLPFVQAEVANIAKTIARFESVLMFASPLRVKEAQDLCGPTVKVLPYPINDCWTRDTAPVFVVDKLKKAMIGRDFQFNGWGNKYPFLLDDKLPVGVCQHLKVPRTDIDLVLEGGAVLCDGEGTLITTETVMLNPNRNPGKTKLEIEALLLAAYGASKVIWLPYGLEFDSITDGHVDLVASYIAPAKLLIYTAPGSGRGDEARMQANKAILQAATDAKGRRFTLVEIHEQPRYTIKNTGTPWAEVLTFSYTNYYATNTAIIVPIANVPNDAAALAVIRSAYPGRQVIGVPARALGWGGGGVHCVTQHIPAAAGVVV
jgi:agmatine deiminase